MEKENASNINHRSFLKATAGLAAASGIVALPNKVNATAHRRIHLNPPGLSGQGQQQEDGERKRIKSRRTGR
jgi:hypothetical protein